MKHPSAILAVLTFFTPLATFAQESASPATFAGSPTLWIAIIIGVIACIITLRYAFSMQGSRVGSVLHFFGWGMLLVVLGFLSVAISWAPETTQKTVHDFAFIIGYVLMLVGAMRLSKLYR